MHRRPKVVRQDMDVRSALRQRNIHRRPRGELSEQKIGKHGSQMVLDGSKPRLIDEWQEVPQLWDAVRYAVDMDTAKGQFILTGSATPNHKGIMHSGAGRIARLHMRPCRFMNPVRQAGKCRLARYAPGKLRRQ